MSLEVRDVVSGYTREVPILKGVDLSARDGLVTVIIGPNGAGKSTLLRTIYGYLQPSRGDVLHDDRSIKGLAPEQMLGEGIAYLDLDAPATRAAGGDRSGPAGPAARAAEGPGLPAEP